MPELKPDFDQYIEDLFDQLPQELKTDDMKIKLILMANDVIMRTMTDLMNREDLEDILTLTQEMEIPLENVLHVYLSSNSYMLERVMEEMEEFAKVFLNFAAHDKAKENKKRQTASRA